MIKKSNIDVEALKCWKTTSTKDRLEWLEAAYEMYLLSKKINKKVILRK